MGRVDGLVVLERDGLGDVRVPDRLAVPEQGREAVAVHVLQAPQRGKVIATRGDAPGEAVREPDRLAGTQGQWSMRRKRVDGDDIPAAAVANPWPHLYGAAVLADTVERGGKCAAAVDDEQIARLQVVAQPGHGAVLDH